ncbi:MAG: hypothetical protein GY891_10670 [Bacteroidetes bacterium]|nr:hypothetical protein [Bacteroidota bacterium]
MKELKEELERLKNQFENLKKSGCRAATPMGILSSQIEVLELKISNQDSTDAEYKFY